MNIRHSFFQPTTSLHPKITSWHLHDNHKLLTEDEITTVIEWFKKNPDQNRHKITSINGEHYNVVKLFDPAEKKFSYHTVYYGDKWGKLLGKGAFANVKLMQDLKTGHWNALRIQKYFNEDDEPQAMQEVDTLMHLHMFIGETTRKDKQHKLIGMSLVSGITLLDFIKQEPSLSDAEWLQIAINIAKAVLDLHQKGKLHCDIKPNNMMIDPPSFHITLIDFQAAVDISNPIHNKSYTAFCYRAWELRKEEKPYIHSEKTDITATGLTIGQLLDAVYHYTGMRHEFHLSGLRFFSSSDPRLEMYCVLKNKEARDEAISFLQKTTLNNPNERPSLPELIDHLESIKNKLISDATISCSTQKR